MLSSSFFLEVLEDRDTTFLFFFWPCFVACGFLVSGLGLNLCPLQWSLNHGTVREGPRTLHLFIPECPSPGSQQGLVEGETGVTQREALMWGFTSLGLYARQTLQTIKRTPMYTQIQSGTDIHTHVYVCAWCEHLSNCGPHVGRDVLWRRM